MVHSKITDEQLAHAVASSTSMMDVLRKLGFKLAGGTHSHYSKRVRRLGLDTSHFLGQGSNKGKSFPLQLKTKEEVLVDRTEYGERRASASMLRRSLTEYGVPYVCQECGVGDTWNGKPFTLHVDHIDGNWLNDTKENLRFLCLNCHSQTETFGNKKTKTEKTKTEIRKPRPTKIEWPDIGELEQMVRDNGYSATGRQLGVSDNAVRKRINVCRSGGI